MHLDWIDENGRGRYKDRATNTQKLIRRRATQAGILTKQKERSLRPSYQSNIWVARPRTQLHAHRDSGAISEHEIDLETPCNILNTFNYRVRSSTDLPIVLSKPDHSVQCALTRPPHGAAILQAQLSSPFILQRLIRFSVPDEQVRYFIILALADAEYLRAIISHYGRSDCLDAAIECLAARVQDLLTDMTNNANTVRLYMKAIHILQRTIAEDAHSERFEIYYAIPLLVVFELLNPEDRLAFLTHGRGAVQLLHLIGPYEMTSELDKTLLAMQSDVMVVENLRDGNTHCCASSEWQDALRHTTQLHLPAGAARSEASVTLNIIATSLPNIFTEVEIQLTKTGTSPDTNLEYWIRTILERLHDWSDCWVSKLREGLRDPFRPSVQHVLLAVYLMYVAMSHRLVAAIPAPPKQRLQSELTALQAAHNAMEIVSNAASYDIIGQARLMLVSKFVRPTIETSPEWQLAIMSPSQNQAIDESLFSTWCIRMGREILPNRPKRFH